MDHFKQFQKQFCPKQNIFYLFELNHAHILMKCIISEEKIKAHLYQQNLHVKLCFDIIFSQQTRICLLKIILKQNKISLSWCIYIYEMKFLIFQIITKLFIKSMLPKLLLFTLMTISTLCSQFSTQFFLPDSQLFQLAQDGIGRCRIFNSSWCNSCACSMYAKTQADDNVNWLGLPDKYGSGCLDGCWGPPNTYLNYTNTVLPICTSNQITNAANMIRIAIVKGFCEVVASATNTTNTANATNTTNTTNVVTNAPANNLQQTISPSSSSQSTLDPTFQILLLSIALLSIICNGLLIGIICCKLKKNNNDIYNNTKENDSGLNIASIPQISQ